VTPNFIRLVIVVAALAFPLQTGTVAQGDNCVAIKRVLASGSLMSFRGNFLTTGKNSRVFESRLQLVGLNCNIVENNDGSSEFLCSRKIANSSERAAYWKAFELKRCLPPYFTCTSDEKDFLGPRTDCKTKAETPLLSFGRIL
jgi:hypothetical protein